MCISFAVYGKEQNIYGMNFDPSDEIDLKLKVDSYCDNSVFYFSGLLGNIYRDIAGINCDGLFVCTQAVEYSTGFKSSSDENDWSVFDIFDEALKKTKKASEFHETLERRVITYPKNPLFPDIGLHTIIADKTGNAFILEEGIKSNIMSPIDNNFIIMTNFPNGGDFNGTSYDKVYGRGSERYICAHEYIDNNIQSFGVNEAFEVLRKTREENTVCSIVYEPLNNEIYISFKADFSRKWKISIVEKNNPIIGWISKQ